MDGFEEAGPPAAPQMEMRKLQQSEAILEAIIRSNKPIALGSDEKRGCLTGLLDAHARKFSDRISPWRRARWLLLFALFLGFVVRVWQLGRHFFVAYGLTAILL